MLWRRFLLTFCCICTLGLLGGCNNKDRPAAANQGTIFGKVTLAGKPLPAGRLSFVDKQGKPAGTARIMSDGSYEITLPIGEVLVSVDTESVKDMIEDQRMKGGPLTSMSPDEFKAKSSGKAAKLDGDRLEYIPVPEKYRKADQSGLSATVQLGRTEKNFVLQ